MKKVNSDELRPEYNRDDLGHGIRGKHYNDYKSGNSGATIKNSIIRIRER